VEPWSIRVVNLPEHADNPVHTEAGGRAAGFGGAVVAGTTVYAYLTRPVAAAWGRDWVATGAAEVRFRAPVLADEPIDIVPRAGDDGAWTIEARGGGTVRALATVERGHRAPPVPAGQRLDPLVAELGDRWAGYAARAGEDLALYGAEGIVHPVVWPSLANRIFAVQLVDGPWVHTRSVIRHLDVARPGEVALVEAWLVERFDSRAGERARVDVRVSVDGRPVATIDHEAIIRPR
jgi:acyl dehydratase